MFGYVSPDTPHLFVKDDTLYKALYCGLCKSIGKGCGSLAKTALTYDMAFMSALLHNIKNQDVKIENKRCALHPIKSRPMTSCDETSVLLGCINTALAYYKLLDDKRDGDIKGALSFLYKRGYKKVLKKHPQVAQIIATQIDRQSALEKDGCAMVDAASEPTAVMMRELSAYVLGEYATENTNALCYAIGKWVYLIDAVDDYDKDVKKGNYNVLYNAFKAPSKAKLVAVCGKDIEFIFNDIFSEMRNNLAKIKFHFNHDLTDNIILLGIPVKTRQLVYGTCQTKKGK